MAMSEREFGTIRGFLAWASSEEGRAELIEAIHSSGHYDRSVAEHILDDHLDTISSLGVIVGSVRIRTLVKEYAASCPSAPPVSDEVLDALSALYHPETTHR